MQAGRRSQAYELAYSAQHHIISIIGRKLFTHNNLRLIVPLGLRRNNGILSGLGQSELHGRLGFDLDCLAGGRVAAHPGCTLGFDQLAQARNRELADLAGLGSRGSDQQIEAGRDLFRRHFHLLSHVPDQLGLGHLLNRCLRTRRGLGRYGLLRWNSRLLRYCFLRRKGGSPVLELCCGYVTLADDQASSISAALDRSRCICAQVTPAAFIGTYTATTSSKLHGKPEPD